jgi:hypothetical protein
MLVFSSADPEFGVCGNSLNGSGGVPRLYLTRGRFHYDTLEKYVGVPRLDDGPALVAYSHDGRSTMSVHVNGILDASRDDVPAVASFGGGNLAMPFTSGNQEHVGRIAELVVYGAELPADERRRVEEYLLAKHGIPGTMKWW